jgi:hypothetical protein
MMTLKYILDSTGIAPAILVTTCELCLNCFHKVSDIQLLLLELAQITIIARVICNWIHLLARASAQNLGVGNSQQSTNGRRCLKWRPNVA